MYHILNVRIINTTSEASSAVDCGFDPQLGQTKDYGISICCLKEKEQRLVGSESG